MRQPVNESLFKCLSPERFIITKGQREKERQREAERVRERRELERERERERVRCSYYRRSGKIEC